MLLVLIVLVGAVAVTALLGATSDLGRLTRGYGPAANANDAALTDIVDAETGVRGFLLTGQAAYLEPYRRGAPRVLDSLDELRNALASVGDHSLDARIAQQRDIARQWLAEVAAPIVAGRQPTEQLQATGKALVDRFRLVNAAVGASLTATRNQMRDAATERSTVALIVIVGSAAAALLIGVGYGLRMSRRLVHPLAGMARAAERWTAGDLELRADEGDGPLEVRAIAHASNRGIDAMLAAQLASRAAATMRERVRPLTAALRVGLDPRTMSQTLVIGLGAAYQVDRVWLRTFDDNRVPNLALQWHAPAMGPVPDFDGAEDTALRALANALWFEDGLLAVDDHDTAREAGPWSAVLASAHFAQARSSVLVAIGEGSSAMGLLTLSHCTAPHAWTNTELGLLRNVGAELAQSLVQSTMLSRQHEVIAQLRDLDETKSALVSTVSHELRTPLTSISGYLEMVLDGDGGPLPDRARDMLSVVDRNTRRLRALIENLLTESRIEAGRMRATLTRVDVHEALQTVMSSLAPVAEAGGVVLALQPQGPSPLLVDGDVGQLEQVVSNLVANAIKFTPRGGTVTVGTGVEPGHLDTATITITDTGIGIPDTELRHLFDRFFRASNAVQAEIPGTGLGLSIVREIVEAHRGSIDVRSTLGEGTTFVIRLPAAAPARSARRA
jgi:signal transduction histidine kinase/CHASE3 domain sensor protein